MTDVDDIVTQQIIAALKKGVIPWKRKWTVIPQQNGESLHIYNGINQIILQLDCMIRGWKYPYWYTFLQAQNAGGHILAGSKSTFIVKVGHYRPKGENGEYQKDKDGEFIYRPFFRTYSVFNYEQTVGLSDPMGDMSGLLLPVPEQLIEESGVEIKVVINETPSFYTTKDYIVVPPIATYEEPEHYYVSVFHELIHWTGAVGRLNRLLPKMTAKDAAKEELIAEIGAAMLCARCGISPETTLENVAGYCQAWIRWFENDHKMIIHCAAKAQEAVEYLLGEPLWGDYAE